MKKVVVRLMGGLGNQLFQYAFGKQLSLQKNAELLLDTSSYLRKGSRTYDLGRFEIKESLLNSFETLLYNLYYYAHLKMKIKSKNIFFENEIFQYCNMLADTDTYYVGYWQNVKYFEKIRHKLLKDLVLKEDYDDKVKCLIEEVNNIESVAVHIRRGDYLLNGNDSYYVVQDMAYYQKAIELLNLKKENLCFYVFSDDLPWCKQNLNLDNNTTFFVGDDITDDPVIQFEIMRNCKHFIIANSTYSWWAAWLSENTDAFKIAPSRWYKEERVNINCKKALLNDFIQI